MDGHQSSMCLVKMYLFYWLCHIYFDLWFVFLDFCFRSKFRLIFFFFWHSIRKIRSIFFKTRYVFDGKMILDFFIWLSYFCPQRNATQNNKIFLIIKHGRHTCWEIHEVRKGIWAFSSWLCFSDTDWMGSDHMDIIRISISILCAIYHVIPYSGGYYRVGQKKKDALSFSNRELLLAGFIQ